MLSDAVSAFVKGFAYNGLRVYAVKPSKGKFAEEQNFEVRVARGKYNAHLLYVKAFHGRPPDYGPWAEVYGISPRVSVGGRRVSYMGSAMEKKVISLFCSSMKDGVIFVCYDDDDETMQALRLSVPPAATRLGCVMLSCGCCWFKDWYFPEGFMEGGMKLQGEKVGNAAERSRMTSELLSEAESFVSSHPRQSREKPIVRAAVRRARAMLGRARRK